MKARRETPSGYLFSFFLGYQCFRKAAIVLKIGYSTIATLLGGIQYNLRLGYFTPDRWCPLREAIEGIASNLRGEDWLSSLSNS